MLYFFLYCAQSVLKIFKPFLHCLYLFFQCIVLFDLAFQYFFNPFNPMHYGILFILQAV